MSTRKQSPRTRAFRPEADALESRQLLSAVVTGSDSKGDTWTLRLIGPGQLTVVKQNGANGSPAPLNSATDIAKIIIGGTNPQTSRLVGTVNTVGKGSDGRVFFENLTETPSVSEKLQGSGLGLLSIDMPNFWLADTSPSTATPTPPSISIPDGVNTLLFGGVDTSVNQPTLTSTSTSDVTAVTLGLPAYGGTRIIIDKAISSSQQAPPATGATTGTTVQHQINFAVSGRLDLFQANSIMGDTVHPPGQFSNIDTAASGTGGTTVFSGTNGITNFLTDPNIKGVVTGQIGDIRIGGNATNFTAIAADTTGSGGAKISNFSVGGQTHNVMVVAPNGLRNAVFGNGMDTTAIYAHVINTLQANNGAINSQVYVDRSISRATFGGDVVKTTVATGAVQNYTTLFETIAGISTSVFSSSTPTGPAAPTNFQGGSGMTVHVAGSVDNSVFASSVQPFNGVFSGPNVLNLTGGRINGKVEGTINNSTITPTTPNQAFFAQTVNSLSGPVVPPSVPQAPYTGAQSPAHFPGLQPLQLHKSTQALAGNIAAAATLTTGNHVATAGLQTTKIVKVKKTSKTKK